MKQLSGLDATFLYLETPEMPMHVGALHVFELPPGYKGKFITALRLHIAARLPLLAPLRRKVWWMPLNLANPAWVDAEPDLKQHIVEVKLPKVNGQGAGLAELEAAVSKLHPVLLDRKKPLWKFHIFEGLAPSPDGRKRVAMYTQLHHAAVDGQAAVALANAILDVTPVPRALDIKPSKRPRTFKLEMTEMLRGVIGNQAQKVAEIVRNLPGTVGTLKNAAGKAVSTSALLTGKKGPSNLTLAPRTPLNLSITTGRAFASVSVPLPELKEMGRAHEATVNDMVLMLCSTALRRYYAKRKQLPRKSMVAAVPISLREKGDTTADNQASMSFISLGTQLSDTRKRLAHIKAATSAMKSTMGSLKSILPTDFPSMGVPWLIEAATALYGKAKVADKIPQVANVVISNVPGPPLPLYMAGAKMITNYPASIIVHGMALNITVQSYDKSLDFGLMADAQAMPDVKELAEAITIAFDDLRALTVPGDAGHDETPAEGVMKQATRRLTGGLMGAMSGAVSGAVSGMVGKAARQVLDSAVDATVAKVTSRGAGKVAAAKKAPAAPRKPRAAAPKSRRSAG